MTRMHPDEFDVDTELVRTLIESQFPSWAHVAVRPVPSAGTDNAMFRLGDDLVARLPRTPGAALRLDKEADWLPVVAPNLPLTVPELVERGVPSAAFPHAWSVYRWIEGRPATKGDLVDSGQAVEDLAAFLRVLRGLDATAGPEPGPATSGRGLPLETRDAATRQALDRLEDEVDVGAASALWEEALAAPGWDDISAWFHGDLWETNLLLDDDARIAAVIDFGCLGVGDPACDLTVAWNLFTPNVRSDFRSALGVDDAMWARGRGWALSFGLIALPYYLETNPVIVANARRMIDEVLAEA